MNLFQLVLLALDTIAELALNPVLGLNEDGARVAALVGVVADFGRRGDEAIGELRAFTDEIKSLADEGARVDPARWDEITARRKAQSAALQELKGDG